ncbi:MAG: DUF3656 domain-containing protein, partial [Fibrobacterota bacterium]
HAESDQLLDTADRRPAEAAQIIQQLSKLGNTPFRLRNCDLSGVGRNLFIPMGLLNRLRRDALRQLVSSPPAPPDLPRPASYSPQEKKLIVLLRNPDELAKIAPQKDLLLCMELPPAQIAEQFSLFENRPHLIPWFPAILIGHHFDAACTLLDRCRFSLIITENSGIAEAARQRNIPWIAASTLNTSNSYTLQALSDEGACGAFPAEELSPGQQQSLLPPPSMELYLPLWTPILLMRSRHCLVRNCTECAKSVMDATCLPTCRKQASITDDQGNRLQVVKEPGFYTALYAHRPRLNLSALTAPGAAGIFCDLRRDDQGFRPEMSLSNTIALLRRALQGKCSPAEVEAIFPPSQQTTAGFSPVSP